MVKDLDGKVPGWGYTESVLIDEGRVICTPGGKGGAIAALDAKSGKILWRSKEFTEPAQYSSPIVINHGGKRQYVQLVMKKLVGIDAKNGKVVWTSDWPGKVAVIPTPIYSDGHVYISSGYGIGCKLVELTSSGAKDVYDNKIMKTIMGESSRSVIMCMAIPTDMGGFARISKPVNWSGTKRKLWAKERLPMQMVAYIALAKEMEGSS